MPRAHRRPFVTTVFGASQGSEASQITANQRLFLGPGPALELGFAADSSVK
jgi:hypothetical protein